MKTLSLVLPIQHTLKVQTVWVFCVERVAVVRALEVGDHEGLLVVPRLPARLEPHGGRVQLDALVVLADDINHQTFLEGGLLNAISLQGPHVSQIYRLGEVLFKYSYSLPEQYGNWSISPETIRRNNDPHPQPNGLMANFTTVDLSKDVKYKAEAAV